MLTQIIDKVNAKRLGLKRFYTGVICTNGHDSERLTSSGECISCKRDRETRKYHANPTYRADHYAQNKERILTRQKISDSERAEEKVAYGERWRDRNKDRIKAYRKENAGLYAFHAARRRKQVSRATPRWAELDKIKALYERASALSTLTGIEHDVDHIVPLVNDAVCGLHCLANLQVITSDDNARKHNKFES